MLKLFAALESSVAMVTRGVARYGRFAANGRNAAGDWCGFTRYSTTGERAGSATVSDAIAAKRLTSGLPRGMARPSTTAGASPSRNARAIAQRRRITMITFGRAARLRGRVDQIKSGHLSASRRDDGGY